MRGFEPSEFQARIARAQTLMDQHDLAALLLTTEANIRYFTGFLTRFWESPTRPWFLVVPASGDPVAVIPSIGASLMRAAGVTDIRTWSAPDLYDDGVTLLADTLVECVPDCGSIGVPDGHETTLRMPLSDFERLKAMLHRRPICSDQGIVGRLRMVKSPAEVAKIETACVIAGRAFARVPEVASSGIPLDQVFRQFQMLCLDEGADWVTYLAGGAELEGYSNVISPAQQKPLERGDVLMLDTGLVWDGYFCDFDRNWSVGEPSSDVASAYVRLIEATEAAFEIARPGVTAADMFHAMNQIVTADSESTEAGRLGHGLGMALTEWPSFIPSDTTPLEPGMVLTLEPAMTVGDKILIHEENVVITEAGARYLSPKAPSEIPVI